MSFADTLTRLDTLVNGLREAAGGDVTARVAAELAARLDKVQAKHLAKHRRTGAAIAAGRAYSAGPGVRVDRIRYNRYIPGDPLRRGLLRTPFVIAQATELYARALLEVTGFTGAARRAAEIVVAESDAKAASRESAKAAKRVARLATRAERAAARVRAREAAKLAKATARESAKVERKRARAAKRKRGSSG